MSTAAQPSFSACSEAVEALLREHGVPLTMGGEPTFVPLRPEGAEWATAALGPTKLGHARRFAHALIADSHPGAVILETTGKHYPGEPLPRWCVLVQSLVNGPALWRNPALLKADDAPGKHTEAHVKAVGRALASALGFEAWALLPLIDADEKPAGLVLPLDHDGEAWRTDDWRADLGNDPVPLFAGDSLAGLRLPLGRLAEGRMRRALTLEVRHGSLTLFIPPLLADAYLALLPLIEACLEKARVSGVVLGGYAPPWDKRIDTLGLASDPGVIEINLTPCPTWAGYDLHLREVYAAAEAVGLCARKFQFNGREVGTGGGAHLVFGGPEPETSPFFTRPALLPSLIRYFQHHPALSYAFTGPYMGPSSQAPRIDESTFEALYELEIACEGAARLGSPANLQLYDLLFRDLLMDRSGNTHRAEISVDKLWNPFAGNGRLGLVEFRAFETHPDPAAQSVAALFVRAILTRLAIDPFKAPFVRWGGELHDRFFLPSFVWDDLEAICADLCSHGIPFDSAWLRPLWEWRFPRLGAFALERTLPGTDEKRPFTLAFRQALEAWPLLGESPNAGGVSRTVDASLDRIEAHLDDAGALETGLLMVNGYPCAFRPADHGAAGGIRYRAFYLYPALQPHIPVHAPLLLEWVDRSTLTVVAAARWHIWNPRAHPYHDRPADPTEARFRQAERWEDWPHTLGQPRYIPRVDFPPEGSHTLDLRRCGWNEA